ncbi:MAG: inositol monophosphatase [Patescibacteria group bacterium]
MEYNTVALKLAKQAGKIIRENFVSGMDREYKEDFTPVTKTDLEINSLVIKTIKKYFPSHDVIGEEESDISANSDYKWYCDPVDGTIPFANHIPVSTFSLALAYKGEIILGVVCEPFMKNVYYAEKGKGAYRNGKKISVSTDQELKGRIIGFEHWSIAKFDISKIMAVVEEDHIKALKFASFVYLSVLVAKGDLMATIFPHTTAHDMAAVDIIVREAGGKVTDLYGQPLNFDKELNGMIASNVLIHDYLLQKIKANVKL